MSNNSIVEHRGSYYFVALREEYLMICMQCSYKKQAKEGCKSRASLHCKALILDILEHWTNTKRDRGEKLTISMTYQQWSDSMYGLFGRSTIIDSLDELIGDGLVSKEPCKIPGNKDTYQYRLNYQELNKRLKQLPERNPNDTQPKRDASQMKPDASQMKRVTRPKRDADPSQMKPFIDTSIDTNNIDTTERKNGASRENSPVATSDESFIRSSNFSSSSSSQEKPSGEKPKVTLTEDEQRIVKFAQKDLFKAMLPEVTEKLKNECAALVPHITTQEKFDSLLGHVKAKLKAPYHLKNMVNALNDWLQTQEKKPLKVKDLATRPFRDLGAYQREIERQYYEKQAAIAKKKAEQAGC